MEDVDPQDERMADDLLDEGRGEGEQSRAKSGLTCGHLRGFGKA